MLGVIDGPPIAETEREIPFPFCANLRPLRAKVLIGCRKIKVNQAWSRLIKVNQGLLKHFFPCFCTNLRYPRMGTDVQKTKVKFRRTSTPAFNSSKTGPRCHFKLAGMALLNYGEAFEQVQRSGQCCIGDDGRDRRFRDCLSRRAIHIVFQRSSSGMFANQLGLVGRTM